jgi:hypothetical protein
MPFVDREMEITSKKQLGKLVDQFLEGVLGETSFKMLFIQFTSNINVKLLFSPENCSEKFLETLKKDLFGKIDTFATFFLQFFWRELQRHFSSELGDLRQIFRDKIEDYFFREISPSLLQVYKKKVRKFPFSFLFFFPTNKCCAGFCKE